MKIREKELIDQRIVDFAKRKVANKKEKITLDIPVDNNIKKILSSVSPVKPTLFKHTINNFDVRHALNRHGKDEIPLTEDDIGLVPDIIKNYDEVKHTKKTLSGNEAIMYKKRYNGNTVYLEEVRNRRKELAFKTMYKVKTPEGANDALPR